MEQVASVVAEAAGGELLEPKTVEPYISAVLD
jgi:hypothetical protein